MIPFEHTVAGCRLTGLHQRGEGPTLVLVHGAGGNQHSFDPLVAALPGRHVLVPNLPGRCGSDGPPLDIAAAASRLLALVEALKLERYLLVGHSMGGAVALEAALRPRTPGLAGLGLLATGARLRVHPTLLTLVADAAARGEHLATAPGLWRPDTPEAVRAAIEQRWHHTPPATVLADWQAVDTFDRLDDLAGVQVPAVVVCGAEDILTPPRYGEHLAQNLPTAHLVTLAGAGHLLPVEHPADTANALLRFIGSLDR